MAITRRQFVTRLGALAAAMGVSQVDLAKMTEALAHGGSQMARGLVAMDQTSPRSFGSTALSARVARPRSSASLRT